MSVPEVVSEKSELEKILEVRVQKEGQGMFARRQFSAGETICLFGAASVADHPDRMSVQISETQHIQLSPSDLQFLNHSCEPNVFFDTDSMKLEALRDIADGEELTFFYPSTEWKMSDGFDCRCGTKSCLGRIGGAVMIPRETAGTYRLSSHIRRLAGL